MKTKPPKTSNDPQNTLGENIFRPHAIQKFAHPEQLNTFLKVVTPSMWIAFVCLAILLLSLLTWAFFGSIPVTVHGKGILMNQNGALFTIDTPKEGIVSNFFIQPGEKISKGQLIAEITDGANRSQNYTQIFKITAQKEGTVLELLVNVGASIKSGDHLVWVEPINAKLDPLVFYAFFPVEQGKTIKLGTPAYITLSSLDSQEYGYLIGSITHLSSFAATPESIAKLVYNKEIAYYFLSNPTPTYQATISLDQDPDTQYYRWTAEKHPPSPITAGTLGEAQAIIERIRPIYYLLPTEGLKYE